MKGKFVDRTGHRVGMLRVLRRGPGSRRANGGSLVNWWCWCEGCEREVVMKGNSLGKDSTKSCGCHNSRTTALRNAKHGLAVRANRHPLYDTWKEIRARCYRKSKACFPNYGGRGIGMCQRWRDDFSAFAADLVNRPAGMSLDRIDVDGHYSCGKCEECQSNGWSSNCRWATKREQANNTRVNIRITFNGQTKTLAEWARELGFPAQTLLTRYYYNWPTEKMFLTPMRKRHKMPETYRVTAIWRSMKHRCEATKNTNYERYGGRGITVCARWSHSRTAFFADMGARPSTKHSIDRIDNDKGYWCGKAECPECGPAGQSPNGSLATAKEQTANRGKRRRTQRRDYTCISQ